MSLIRVASLKPTIQNKINPLIKQARSGGFKSAKDALEYHIMALILKYEKTTDGGFVSLNQIIQLERLTDVEFEDITLLSYRFPTDPMVLADRHTGKIMWGHDTRLSLVAEVRIVLTGKAESKHNRATMKKMTKKIEFVWTPHTLFAMPPYNRIIYQMLVADGYPVELTR